MAPESTEAINAVYERVNRSDQISEYWQHDKGCRAWLLIHRNPSSGEILEILPLNSVVKPGGAE